MEKGKIFPYLIPGLFNSDEEPNTIHIGHGVYATLFEDHETEGGIVHQMVTQRHLDQAGLSAEAAHRIAIENLYNFFQEPDQISIQMLGEPGAEVNFMIYGNHARASACLLLPDLFDQASYYLQTDELCACVPQRERLIVLPQRDRSYREGLIAKIAEIERDARRPISLELFELREDGVFPFVEKS